MKIALIIIVLVVLGIAGWAVFGNMNEDTKSTTQPTTTNQQQTEQTQQPANNDFGSSQTITYNDVGFSPEMLTSKVGEKVTVENKSTGTLMFRSDPHPTHTDNPELNLSPVEPGGSITFTPTVIGNFGFHDHSKPDHKGRIVVQ